MKTTGLVFTICILLAFDCNRRIDNNPNTFTLTESTRLLNDYLVALSTGDTNAVKPFWSQRSLVRSEFWTIHNNFSLWGSFADWRKSVEDGRYEIKNVDRETDHYVMGIRKLPKDSAVVGQIRDVKYYVVRKNEHWVFINPLDLLTGDWKTYTTEHIAFHYPPDIVINDYLDEIRYAESESANALRLFGLTLTKKIDFYRARSDVECGKLMNFGPVNGYALIPPFSGIAGASDFGFVVSSSFVNHHELIHLIAGRSGIPDENPAITEGLACAFAGGFHTTPAFIINDARNQVSQSFHYPLKTLLTMDTRTFLLNNFVTYSEAGSFVRYLYERYGMEKLRVLCSGPLKGDEVISSLETTYDRTIAQLEQEWIIYLTDNRMHEIGHIIPSMAQSVFSMTDAEGDDTGDGDYAYPAYGGYPQGCFDLKKFDVLKDQKRAYFRLEFNKLKAPLVLGIEHGSEKLVPGGIIAVQKGKGGKRHLQKFCHGVRFEHDEGYDFKLNIGTCISLTNNFGELIFSSPDMVSEISKYEHNIIEFSVPIELIGKPSEDWRYFVGTCLVSDRMMNFLGEPLPVHKNPPVPIFISGGNYDYGNQSFMDILLPPEADQRSLLATYSADLGELAIVPMIKNKDAFSKD